MPCAARSRFNTHSKRRTQSYLPQRQMQFRIGINLGDVIVEGERLYGDGVNIAARLESLAIPGGICVSGTVYDQVENKLALTYEDSGRTDGQEHRQAGARLSRGDGCRDSCLRRASSCFDKLSTNGHRLRSS